MTEVSERDNDGNIASFVYSIGENYISRQSVISPTKTTSPEYSKVLHEIQDSSSANYCQFPDIIITVNGNFIYTSGFGLGLGVYGTQKTASQVNKIIDSKGRDLSALNGKRVYSVSTGQNAIVDSVSTTTETNDTLNFADGITLSQNGSWVCFLDEYKNLNTGVAQPQFFNQPSTAYWSRQILNVDGDYFIGNGNYIAKLDNDESTFDNDYTKLEANMQFACMSLNNNWVLIGGNINNKGKLLLWDGVSQSNYNSSLDLPYKVHAIKPYLSGWLIFAGTSLYFCDGGTVKLLAVIPDTDGNGKVYVSPNGMMIENEKVLINIGFDNVSDIKYNRLKSGIWEYDLNSGSFSYTPKETTSGKEAIGSLDAGMIFKSSNENKVFSSFMSRGFNNTLNVFKPTTATKSFLFKHLNFGQALNLDGIEMSIARTYDYNADTKDTSEITAKIIVGIADNDRIFNGRTSAGSNSTAANNLKVNLQTAFIPQVGDMVRIASGSRAGEIAFITQIEGSGTSSGTLTLDRNLSGNVSSGDVIIYYPFKLIGEHNLSGTTIKNPLTFAKGRRIGGDCFIMVYINSNYPLEIRNISI
jgi:hypothetical protein